MSGGDSKLDELREWARSMRDLYASEMRANDDDEAFGHATGWRDAMLELLHRLDADRE